MKYSQQREKIKEAVLSVRDHPTADEVYLRLKPDFPALSLGTVYRNLNLLVEMGEIIRVTVPGGSDRFDGDTALHLHIRCSHCGRVFDLAPGTPVFAEGFDEAVRQQTGVEVTHGAQVVTGICAGCRENQ